MYLLLILFIYLLNANEIQQNMLIIDKSFINENHFSPWLKYSDEIESIEIKTTVPVIPDYAFADLSNVETISINSNCESIGDFAFSNLMKLTKVLLPASIRSLGKGAFYNCQSLESIYIPSKVLIIESYLFWNCINLEKVVFTGLIESIEDYSFYNNLKLNDINLRKSLISIGTNAFTNCRSLPSLTLFGTVEIIDREAFQFCSSIKSVILSIRIMFVGDGVFEGIQSISSIQVNGEGDMVDYYRPHISPFYHFRESVTDITIDNGVESIGTYAFYDFKKISSIYIPYSVVRLGQYSFKNCVLLKTITIDGNLNSIENGSFENCPLLESVIYKGRTKPACEYSVLDSNRFTEIPVSSKYKGNSFCERSIRFSFGDTLVGSFDVNTFILSINGTGIIDGSFVFNDEIKSSATSVGIADDVVSLASYLFENFSKMTSLSIGKSLTDVETYSFNGCNQFVEFVLNENNTKYKISENCLVSVDGDTIYRYPIGRNDTNFTITAPVKSLHENAFRYSRFIESISIETYINTIGKRAFANCNKLKSVYYGKETVPVCDKTVFVNTNVKQVDVTLNYNIFKTFCGKKIMLVFDSLTIGTIGGIIGGVLLIFIVSVIIVVLVIVKKCKMKKTMIMIDETIPPKEN